MFNFQNACGQGLGGVARQDRDDALTENLAFVVLLGHQVHGRPRGGVTRRQDRLVHLPAVHAGTAVLREQRGMDVDDSAAPFPDDGPRHPLQITRKHDELGSRRDQFPAPLLRIRDIFQDVHGDAVLPGQLDPAGVGPIADDQDDPRRGLASERAEERRQIAAPSGNRHGDAQEHSPQI